MLELKSFIVPIVVAMLTIAVNAIINIKIKFAPDATQAFGTLKRFALRTISWLLNIYLTIHLILIVFSNAPVTRFSIFDIAITIVVLTLVAIGYVLERIIKSMLELAETVGRHVSVTKDLVGVLGGEVDSLPSGQSSAKLNNEH